jgi:CheY-like chemotaxis protein
MKREEVKETIEKELEKLRNILERTPEKIIEIVDEFINETPRIIDSIRLKIDDSHFALAIPEIHKVKVRYSYIGFEDIYELLNNWELRFKRNETVPNIQHEISELFNYTQTIIAVLKDLDINSLGKQSKPDAQPLIGKKVLVAEDDEINAMVFEAFIQELGGEIMVAQDGFEAINQASAFTPDLIFMDVHMPYCSGVDAIKTIRSKGIQTPIISLSASSRLNERNESLQAGANDFLTKPANRLSIRQALLKHLG